MVYEEDELVSNSDDEKRIYQGERKAKRIFKRKHSNAANAQRNSPAICGGQTQCQCRHG